MSANPLGSQLRAIRLSRGLSALSVATKAGIKYAHYLDIELDRHPYPRPHTVKAIEQALGVAITVSVVDVGESKNPS